MENVTFLDTINKDGTLLTFVIIDRGNQVFTSMLKSDWDELQAKQTEGGLN